MGDNSLFDLDEYDSASINTESILSDFIVRDQNHRDNIRAQESQRIIQARSRPPPPVPPPSRNVYAMDESVPVSSHYHPEENEYDFPPPPVMNTSYGNKQHANQVHYRQAPGNFHEARIERGRKLIDMPNSEVVVPQSQGVGTLATKFEKQARLVALDDEINKPKPPKPLFYREEHKSKLDDINNQIHQQRRPHYDYDYRN